MAAAVTWKGKWGGAVSTLQFLDGHRLKYCYGIECLVTSYSGDEKGTLTFNWVNSRYKFKWNGSGYEGTYDNGLNHATIVMKKAP